MTHHAGGGQTAAARSHAGGHKIPAPGAFIEAIPAGFYRVLERPDIKR
jgi:hypothetical protein